MYIPNTFSCVDKPYMFHINFEKRPRCTVEFKDHEPTLGNLLSSAQPLLGEYEHQWGGNTYLGLEVILTSGGS